MLEKGVKLRDLFRLVALMIVGAVATTLVLLATAPEASQFAIICASVVTALILALFDAGMFNWEGEPE